MSIFTTDDGTIATEETEDYNLFGAEHFSEVDTCVEILSRPPPTPISTIRKKKNDRNHKSRSNRRLSSHGIHDHDHHDQSSSISKRSSSRSVVQKMEQLKAIDEDVDKLVREDVRKMIAKIRNSTQATKGHVHDDKSTGNSSSDKKLVRPGKYGELDLRYASAQVRKELFLKHKQEKIKKRKVSDSDSRCGPGSVTTTGELKEVRDQPEQSENSMSRTEDAMRTKGGYYKNTQEGSPEQVSIAETEKIKSNLTSSAGQNSALKQSMVTNVEEDTTEIKSTEGIHSSVTLFAGQNTASVTVLSMMLNLCTSAEDRVADAQTVTPKGNTTQTKECTASESLQQDALTEQPNVYAVEEETQVEDKDGTSIVPPGEDLSETSRVKESILSMPKIEKTREADDLEVIECVLATLTDLEEEQNARDREFGKRPDPSVDQTCVEELDVEEEQLVTDDGNEENPPGSQPCEMEDRKSRVFLTQAEPPAGRTLLSSPLSPAQQATRELVTPLLKPAKDTKMVGMPLEAVDFKQGDAHTATQNDAMEGPDSPTKEEATTRGEVPDDGTVVELVLVSDSDRVRHLEKENAKLRDALNFLQRTAVEKEKYFAELAWFGKRSESEVKKWRPNFWRERLADLGPELFEEFRADAMRIADPDVGDWEHGFSSGALAMARLLLGLSHALEDETICAFHDPDQPCTKHCVTCSVAEQRARELADFPVLDP
jgi:hypothetical protein